jgi:hypothetical protein
MKDCEIQASNVRAFHKEAGTIIRHQLEEMLKIIDLEDQSGIAEVDSYCIRSSPLPVPASQNLACDRNLVKRAEEGPAAEDLHSYQTIEPRLGMIGGFLRQVLRAGQFEFQGNAVPIQGFRLKNLSYWAKYPFASLFENLNFESVTSACSSDCEFCFLDGMGPLRPRGRRLTMREARTRARYYSSTTRKGLPVPTSLPGEPLLHPQFLDFLRIARESDHEECFFLTTNGDFLTKEIIEQLARLKPLSICVSLNSADPATRARIMRSKRSKVAIESIPLLHEAGISFIGSIVTSPSLSLDDIANTARYLDQHSALAVRLLLTGYTKYQTPAAAFNTDYWWGEIAGLGKKLRTELGTPVGMQPNFYWDQSISPRIDGVYRNSPADHAGLQAGDLVVEIQGQPIVTKAGILDAFQTRTDTSHSVKITILRNEKEIGVELTADMKPEDDFYPFKPKGYRLGTGSPEGFCLGIHVAQGFRLEYLRALKNLVEKRPEAKNVLVFTTPLVQNHLLQALELAGNMPECRLDGVVLRTTVAAQVYWGGNIVIGDLHVSQDYVDHLRRLVDCGYRPDLVIIPGSFVNMWGFDVSGISYTEIERLTGIPVELLPIERIMW